ncbi:MFS transporter [Falsiroseomonas sp. HW251]|uniref:MFS transporter n=1 Tax=Falsiroseomonas sp. HW251 TaxID=3390998 RepID=UPI003D32363F
MTATARVVVALGTTQTLAWACSYYLPAILAAPMARSLEVPASWVFGCFSASLVLSALLGPWAGKLIDRRGGRDVLVVSNLVIAAGLTTLALSHSIALLAVGWLLLGVGMSMGLYDAAFATLAGLYGRNARSPITGITLIAGFASTVGWPLSAVMEDAFGWRWACLAWAALQLLVALPLNRLLIPPAPPPEKLAMAEQGEAVPPPRWAMPILAYLFAAVWTVTGALAAHMPTLLEAAGATPAMAIAAAALIGPSQVAARLLEFGLRRRLSPVVSARLSTLGNPLGTIALLAFGPVAAPAFAILHGMGNGILTIVKGTLPLQVFGPVGYGSRQGLLSAPSRFMQALAPFLFGLLLERASVATALSITAAMMLSAFVALLLLRVPIRPPAGSARDRAG